jgi:Flp pilus assembly protein TadD
LQFRTAVTLNPDNLNNLHQLGQAQVKFKQLNEALETFTRMTALSEKDFRGWNALGITYTRLGRFREAEDSFRKSAASGHKGEESNIATAIYYQRRFAEATGLFEKAVQANDGKELYVGNYADGLRANGQKERAIEQYRKALALAPDAPADADVQGRLALYLAHLGSLTGDPTPLPEALRRVCVARSLRSDDGDLAAFEATVHLLSGRTAQARDALSEALQLGYPLAQFKGEPDFDTLMKSYSAGYKPATNYKERCAGVLK